MPDLAMNKGSDSNAIYMEKAIELALGGIYSTTPNPNVGCVIVDASGKIVGMGAHHVAGLAHAEINALNQARELAKGATAFVTLEPCSHWGKTGPCANALVDAGIVRVVIANADPNPLVSGNGVRILEDAGVQVETGFLAKEASVLNEGFFKRMRDKMPFVTLKLASSMDGKIALKNGKSKWITSADSRQDVHIERAKQCALITGADTVLADNPNMTVRLSQPNQAIAQSYNRRNTPLLRIVIDSKNRLGSKHNIFNQDAPTLVLNANANKNLPEHVEQWQIPSNGDYICLTSALSELANKKQINNLWIESGASLAGAFIKQKLVDKLLLYQAPILLGDKAKSLLNLPEITELAQAEKAELVSAQTIGKDLKLELRFK